MTVAKFIEMFRRQYYNGMPNDDATVTKGLVRAWLPQACAYAAQRNYNDNYKLDGIEYVNNSFYSKFTGIALSGGQNFLWRFTLPQIPVGIQATDGLSKVTLSDDAGRETQPLVMLTEKQTTFYQGMRPIPNKTLCYYEGKTAYAISTLILSQYTANVTMISAGDFSDSSELIVPDDYLPAVMEYLQKQLIGIEKQQPIDASNDGFDGIRSA